MGFPRQEYWSGLPFPSPGIFPTQGLNPRLLQVFVAQMVKRLPAMQETQVQSLGQEDTLQKEMETHSSTLSWKIPWTEKPGGLQSIGSQDTTEQLHLHSLAWKADSLPLCHLGSPHGFCSWFLSWFECDIPMTWSSKMVAKSNFLPEVPPDDSLSSDGNEHYQYKSTFLS